MCFSYQQYFVTWLSGARVSVTISVVVQYCLVTYDIKIFRNGSDWIPAGDHAAYEPDAEGDPETNTIFPEHVGRLSEGDYTHKSLALKLDDDDLR